MQERDPNTYGGATGYGERSGTADYDAGIDGGTTQVKTRLPETEEGQQNKAAEIAGQVREQATEKVEQARESTAEQMASTASTVRDQFEGKGGVQEKAGVAVADGMEKTAQYLREHDTQAMMTDVERFVREHPTQAVVGAVAVGFIVGRILR